MKPGSRACSGSRLCNRVSGPRHSACAWDRLPTKTIRPSLTATASGAAGFSSVTVTMEPPEKMMSASPDRVPGEISWDITSHLLPCE